MAPAIEVEAAKDHHGKHLQADQRELHVDAQHASPHHAAHRCDDAAHRPGQREIALDVDAHGHRHLLVVGDGAHGNAHAALEEEPGEDGEKASVTTTPAIWSCGMVAGPSATGVADRQRQRARFAAEGERRQAAHHGAEADGGHDDRDDGSAKQRPQHGALQREAEQHHDRRWLSRPLRVPACPGEIVTAAT